MERWGNFVTPARTPVMGWVGPRTPTHPPAFCRCERAIDSTPTHPATLDFFVTGSVKARAPHTLAVALFRALRARAGSALRLLPMGAGHTRQAALAGSSSALVDCAHSIRRALLLPHTKRGRGGGRGNAPARGRCMHAPDMRHPQIYGSQAPAEGQWSRRRRPTKAARQAPKAVAGTRRRRLESQGHNKSLACITRIFASRRFAPNVDLPKACQKSAENPPKVCRRLRQSSATSQKSVVGTCGAAVLKAKITELPRAEASARVAATKI